MPAQPIAIALTNGIDTRNPPHMVQAPYLLAAKNRYFQGDVGLKKRNGYTALPKTILNPTGTATTVTQGTSLTAFKNELLLFDDTNIFSYSPANSAWARRDYVIPTTTALRPAAINGFTQFCCDYANTGAIEAWVYQDNRNNTDIRLTVADVATGAILVNDQVVASNRLAPRFAQVAGGWIILAAAVNGNTNNAPCALYGRAFFGSVTNPVGTEYLIDGNVWAPQAYDCIFDGTNGVIAWMEPPAGGAVVGAVTVAPLHKLGRIATYAESGYYISSAPQFATSHGIYFTDGNEARICLAVDPTRPGYAMVTVQTDQGSLLPVQYRSRFINVAAGTTWTWSDPSVVVFLMQDYISSAANSPLLSRSLTSIVDSSGVGHVFANVLIGNSLNALATGATWDTFHFSTNSAGLYTSVQYAQSLLGKMFLYNGDVYQWLINSPWVATYQPTAFVYNWSKSKVVARVAADVAAIQQGPTSISDSIGPVSVLATPLPAVFVSGSQIQLPGLSETRLISEDGTTYTQNNAFNFVVNFVHAWQLQSAIYGETKVLCGGLVLMYDGAVVTEQGFLLAPEAAASFGATTYQAVAIWEWVDKNGQLHRSSPSLPFSYSPGAVMQFLALPFTNKVNASLVLYRTTSNGSIFYRATPFGTPVFNNTSARYVSISDNSITDTAIQNNEILYTVGGELDNDSAPSCQIICSTKDRLLVAGGEKNDVVTYTKEFVEGLGPQFSLALQRQINILPGAITAVGAMDDYIIVFKNPGIFYWSGNGPSSAGTNDDFTQTEMLTDELGCVSAESLIYTQDGIYFQSSKGLHLLTRSLELINVGQPVQGYNQQTVISAVMMPDDEHIRFGCLEDETLVYHYRLVQAFGTAQIPCGQWTTFANHAQFGACLWQGQYAFVRADGSVWVETPGQYQDPTGPYSAPIKLPHLKVGQPLQDGNFKQLAVLGQYGGPHVMRGELSYDYQTVPRACVQFDTLTGCATSEWGDDPVWGASPWGGDADDVYMFIAGMLPIQTSALGVIQVTLIDSGVPGQPFGDSAIIESIAFMAEAQPRLLRAGQKHQVG